MRRRSQRLCLSLALAALCLACASLSAGERPPYRVLQMQPGGTPIPSPATPYAYGWFGACPRAHASRQFGYYDTYRQWSFR